MSTGLGSAAGTSVGAALAAMDGDTVSVTTGVGGGVESTTTTAGATATCAATEAFAGFGCGRSVHAAASPPRPSSSNAGSFQVAMPRRSGTTAVGAALPLAPAASCNCSTRPCMAVSRAFLIASWIRSMWRLAFNQDGRALNFGADATRGSCGGQPKRRSTRWPKNFAKSPADTPLSPTPGCFARQGFNSTSLRICEYGLGLFVSEKHYVANAFV